MHREIFYLPLVLPLGAAWGSGDDRMEAWDQLFVVCQ